MTVLEVIQRSTEFLTRRGIESPRLQVELLLAGVLKLRRLQLYLNFERVLSEPELETMRQFVKRRSGHEPLQHILGTTSFCGLEVRVSRDVLVPRPETEVLAEHAWLFLEGLAKTEARPLVALDFGTGSGCLAVTLAAKVPQAKVYALDASAAALDIARENASQLGLSDRIHFLEAADFTTLPQDLRFDLIVSNPPYIPSAEIATLQPEVREFDPRLALDGGSDGLRILQLLAEQAGPCLQPPGRLMVEFGDGQAPALRKIFAARGWLVDRVEKDLSGRERILVARLVES